MGPYWQEAEGYGSIQIYIPACLSTTAYDTDLPGQIRELANCMWVFSFQDF